MTPFGEYLERLRKQRKITQTRLAQLLDVTPGYLSAIENGRKVPSTTHLISQLSKHLKLTPAEYQSLLDAHKKSKFLWRVPENIRSEEFGLLDELWDQLGYLTTEKVQTMRMLLRIGCAEQSDYSYDKSKTLNQFPK